MCLLIASAFLTRRKLHSLQGFLWSYPYKEHFMPTAHWMKQWRHHIFPFSGAMILNKTLEGHNFFFKSHFTVLTFKLNSEFHYLLHAFIFPQIFMSTNLSNLIIWIHSHQNGWWDHWKCNVYLLLALWNYFFSLQVIYQYTETGSEQNSSLPWPWLY